MKKFLPILAAVALLAAGTVFAQDSAPEAIQEQDKATTQDEAGSQNSADRPVERGVAGQGGAEEGAGTVNPETDPGRVDHDPGKAPIEQPGTDDPGAGADSGTGDSAR